MTRWTLAGSDEALAKYGPWLTLRRNKSHPLTEYKVTGRRLELNPSLSSGTFRPGELRRNRGTESGWVPSFIEAENKF